MDDFASIIGWIQSIAKSPSPVIPPFWEDIFVHQGLAEMKHKADHQIS